MLLLCVHCSCALSALLGDSSQVPAQLNTVCSEPVDMAEMRTGTLVFFLLVNEYITMLKWSENLRETGSSGGRKGIRHHNTGVHAWQHGQRVAGVGTTRRKCELEGVVCPAFPGCKTKSITTAFFFHLLDAYLPEGWSESVGEGGLNKYLYFKRGEKVYHNDILQVYTTQGVRHKFTCGKQAIHRCNPTKNPCDQTINLCKVAASVLISSHCLWILFAISHARWNEMAYHKLVPSQKVGTTDKPCWQQWDMDVPF